MIKYYEYNGTEQGLNLVITGAIHGNEICGTEAIKRIISKIESDELKLLKGSITLIPISNPKAYEQNIRFIEENLNRVFKYHDVPKTYEQGLANELTSIIGECDLLIDLHSIHSKGEPFIMNFGIFSDAEDKIKEALGIDCFIHGWAEAYEKSFPSGTINANSHTVSFMHSQGKMAIGVECGLHDDSNSIDVAENVILNALSYLNMINRTVEKTLNKSDILIKEVFLKSQDEELLEDFIHGQRIEKGTAISNKYSAEDNCLILFPRKNCPLGEEIFYIGELL